MHRFLPRCNESALHLVGSEDSYAELGGEGPVCGERVPRGIWCLLAGDSAARVMGAALCFPGRMWGRG